MRRRDVVAASVPALVVMTAVGPVLTGVFASLKSLVTGGGASLDQLAFITTAGWIPAAFVVAVLGPMPVALAVAVWDETQRNLGTRRAIDAVSLLVAATVAVELFLPVCVFAEPFAAGLALLAVYSLTAGLLARIALRLTWSAVDPWARTSEEGR